MHKKGLSSQKFIFEDFVKSIGRGALALDQSVQKVLLLALVSDLAFESYLFNCKDFGRACSKKIPPQRMYVIPLQLQNKNL